MISAYPPCRGEFTEVLPMVMYIYPRSMNRRSAYRKEEEIGRKRGEGGGRGGESESEKELR